MDSNNFLDTAPWHTLRDPAQPPTAPARTTPAPRRPQWWMLAALALAAFAGIALFGLDSVLHPRMSAAQPVPVATVTPLTVRYAMPSGSLKGYAIVEKDITTHPPIKTGTPLLILLAQSSYAARRAYDERCAACHAPYKGRALPRGR